MIIKVSGYLLPDPHISRHTLTLTTLGIPLKILQTSSCMITTTYYIQFIKMKTINILHINHKTP